MKRYFSILLFAAATFLGAAGQSLSYLTFRLTDGTEQSIAAVGTKITFSDGQLIATNGAETATFTTADVQKMFFSATATGIATATDGQRISAAIVGGQLQVEAPAGTAVALYNAEGRRVSPTARLEKGLYIVRVGSETLKILSE